MLHLWLSRAVAFWLSQLSNAENIWPLQSPISYAKHKDQPRRLSHVKTLTKFLRNLLQLRPASCGSCASGELLVGAPHCHWLYLPTVSSHHMHNMIQNCIDCICLTFLHCVFFNVPVKALPRVALQSSSLVRHTATGFAFRLTNLWYLSTSDQAIPGQTMLCHVQCICPHHTKPDPVKQCHILTVLAVHPVIS